MGERTNGRKAIDALVKRQKDQAEKDKRPFDHKSATERARESARRVDNRQRR